MREYFYPDHPRIGEPHPDVPEWPELAVAIYRLLACGRYFVLAGDTVQFMTGRTPRRPSTVTAYVRPGAVRDLPGITLVARSEQWWQRHAAVFERVAGPGVPAIRPEVEGNL